MNLAFILVILLVLGVGIATGGTMTNTASASATTPPQTPTSGHASDGSITGAAITADQSTWPGSDPLWNICAAVALAEGFNQGSGTAPYDLNNPGDLSPGDENGQATAGPPQAHGGSRIIYFTVVEGGFRALYQKFSNIVNGDSSVYPASYTWTQVAGTYAGNASAWLNNVTTYLGVDPSSTPAQYVQGPASV